MDWIKKYWLIFIVVALLLLLPLLINLCYNWESDCAALHAPTAWATFWATYLSAIASFTMIYFTWKTLKEMQRQWNEQNTPIISCTLEKASDYIMIELHNTSQVPAHKVGVRITNNIGKDIFRFDKTCEWLEKMTFEIPPFSVKQIAIAIVPYIDGDYEGYLSVEVSYNNKKELFDLFLKEINVTTWKYSTKDICDKIGHLDSTIRTIK